MRGNKCFLKIISLALVLIFLSGQISPLYAAIGDYRRSGNAGSSRTYDMDWAPKLMDDITMDFGEGMQYLAMSTACTLVGIGAGYVGGQIVGSMAQAGTIGAVGTTSYVLTSAAVYGATGAMAGAINAGIMGGDVGKGALTGGLTGAVSGGIGASGIGGINITNATAYGAGIGAVAGAGIGYLVDKDNWWMYAAQGAISGGMAGYGSAKYQQSVQVEKPLVCELPSNDNASKGDPVFGSSENNKSYSSNTTGNRYNKTGGYDSTSGSHYTDSSGNRNVYVNNGKTTTVLCDTGKTTYGGNMPIVHQTSNGTNFYWQGSDNYARLAHSLSLDSNPNNLPDWISESSTGDRRDAYYSGSDNTSTVYTYQASNTGSSTYELARTLAFEGKRVLYDSKTAESLSTSFTKTKFFKEFAMGYTTRVLTGLTQEVIMNEVYLNTLRCENCGKSNERWVWDRDKAELYSAIGTGLVGGLINAPAALGNKDVLNEASKEGTGEVLLTMAKGALVGGLSGLAGGLLVQEIKESKGLTYEDIDKIKDIREKRAKERKLDEFNFVAPTLYQVGGLIGGAVGRALVDPTTYKVYAGTYKVTKADENSTALQAINKEGDILKVATKDRELVMGEPEHGFLYREGDVIDSQHNVYDSMEGKPLALTVAMKEVSSDKQLPGESFMDYADRVDADTYKQSKVYDRGDIIDNQGNKYIMKPGISYTLTDKTEGNKPKYVDVYSSETAGIGTIAGRILLAPLKELAHEWPTLLGSAAEGFAKQAWAKHVYKDHKTDKNYMKYQAFGSVIGDTVDYTVSGLAGYAGYSTGLVYMTTPQKLQHQEYLTKLALNDNLKTYTNELKDREYNDWSEDTKKDAQDVAKDGMINDWLGAKDNWGGKDNLTPKERSVIFNKKRGSDLTAKEEKIWAEIDKKYGQGFAQAIVEKMPKKSEFSQAEVESYIGKQLSSVTGKREFLGNMVASREGALLESIENQSFSKGLDTLGSSPSSAMWQSTWLGLRSGLLSRTLMPALNVELTYALYRNGASEMSAAYATNLSTSVVRGFGWWLGTKMSVDDEFFVVKPVNTNLTGDDLKKDIKRYNEEINKAPTAGGLGASILFSVADSQKNFLESSLTFGYKIGDYSTLQFVGLMSNMKSISAPLAAPNTIRDSETGKYKTDSYYVGVLSSGAVTNLVSLANSSSTVANFFGFKPERFVHFTPEAAAHAVRKADLLAAQADKNHVLLPEDKLKAAKEKAGYWVLYQDDSRKLLGVRPWDYSRPLSITKATWRDIVNDIGRDPNIRTNLNGATK